MRIAFVGVSHWHGPLYYRPAARLSGVRIVGVSDPDGSVAERAAAELEARAFRDYRDLLAEVRPDFVFAFGRHCDMAETAMAIIDAGVPLLIEKPAGLNREQAAAVRDAARAKGLYAATGFNFRVADFYRKILEVIGDDPVTHASFRFMAGGPNRYREAGCAWMLDPKLSGGGPTINLSGHFVDMFRLFTRSAPTEVTALMGNFTWGLPIEDYSSVILRSGSSVCTIETAYTFPAPLGVFDLRFSIRTSRHYIVVRNDDCLEIYRTCDGVMERISTPVSNAYWYPVFVTETLDRFAKGRPPVAGLDDLVDVMEVIDAAYASSRGGGARISLAGQARK
jgi:predicted dehydrogenase